MGDDRDFDDVMNATDEEIVQALTDAGFDADRVVRRARKTVREALEFDTPIGRARRAGRRLAEYWKTQVRGEEGLHGILVKKWRRDLSNALGSDETLLFPGACDRARALREEVERLRAERARLLGALRDVAISAQRCRLCGAVWSHPWAEHHGTGCLAAAPTTKGEADDADG